MSHDASVDPRRERVKGFLGVSAKTWLEPRLHAACAILMPEGMKWTAAPPTLPPGVQRATCPILTGGSAAAHTADAERRPSCTGIGVAMDMDARHRLRRQPTVTDNLVLTARYLRWKAHRVVAKSRRHRAEAQRLREGVQPTSATYLP